MSIMNQQGLKNTEALCTQEHLPECMAACPLHLDMRGIMSAVSKNDFDSALAIMEKTLPFPAVIAHCCDAPCTLRCKRGECGGSLEINAVERAVIEYGKPKTTAAFTPKRAKSAAVVGGGLSAYCCALELRKKGYAVELYIDGTDLSDALTPKLNMPQAALAKDLDRVEAAGVSVYSKKIDSALLGDMLERFDSVYTSDERLFGGIPDSGTLMTSEQKLFAGGHIINRREFSPIKELEDGRRAAISMDRFMQGVSLEAGREGEGAHETRLFTDISAVAHLSPVLPSCAYTEKQAVAEANRCLNCQCLNCVQGCKFLEHYKSYPRRYVREVYNNLSIAMGIRHANGMINSCMLCGQCGALCPQSLNMADVFSEARENMCETGRMPPSAHDFAMRDMEFSNSDAFFLAKHQSGTDKSEYVFFPGCQLAASSPELAEKCYDDLVQRLTGGVGIMLGCCGIIAKWAGRAESFGQAAARMREGLASLGAKKLITACPSCYSVFKEELQGVEIIGVWDILNELGLPEGCRTGSGKISVHDACTTRFDGGVQDSIRSIISKLGLKIEELPYSREKTGCCAYGGLTMYANPPLADEIAAAKISESKNDYLCYCINCRDRFAKKGKNAFHILELVYAHPLKDPPGFSQRRYNRQKLKQKYSGEAMRKNEYAPLIIGGDLKPLLEERMILEQDILETIDWCEKNGSTLYDGSDGSTVAYRRLGSVTYWVSYKKTPEGNALIRAYSHRMDITGGSAHDA